jgi:hypothetical protein
MSASVDLIPQFPGTLERHHPSCRQDGILTRCWIPPPALGLFLYTEFAEPTYQDIFIRFQTGLDHFLKYMAGQFSPLERKSIEPIALAVKDGDVRAMQRFISDAPLDDF